MCQVEKNMRKKRFWTGISILLLNLWQLQSND